MDWANLGLPCLLVRPLTNLQSKEGLRIPYRLGAEENPDYSMHLYEFWVVSHALSILIEIDFITILFYK